MSPLVHYAAVPALHAVTHFRRSVPNTGETKTKKWGTFLLQNAPKKHRARRVEEVRRRRFAVN